MRIRPSRYNALLHQVGFMHLWEDDQYNLFLPWHGVKGKVFPVDPSSGTVRIDGLMICAPFGHPEPAPDAIIVEDVLSAPVQVICQLQAPANAPEWLRSAHFKLTTLAPVTLVENLTCTGVG